MARPLRVAVVGGLRHVIVRGNERRDVFRDDADRSRYLSRRAFYREKFSLRVLASRGMLRESKDWTSIACEDEVGIESLRARV